MTKVVMYSAMWCGDCRRSQRFLDEHKVEYEYLDIMARPELADQVVQYNIQAGFGPKRRIPVILVDDQILSEPSNAELARALGIKE